MYGRELVDPISPLQDPHSDLSLFLSKKIREQAAELNPSKEWSHYLQEKLIQTITPDFEKKFPKSRLGAAAVKRVWEKMNHLNELFQNQNEALKPDGKLNVHFLIRENLKTVLKQKRGISSHPFLVAQQLAVKVGEALASYEGVRPELGHLTDLIWSSLSHLLPAEKLPLFKTKLDTKDRLILKWMLDILTTQPGIEYSELQTFLHSKLAQFRKFKGTFAQDVMQLTFDWASKLFPFTTYYQNNSSAAIQNLCKWVKERLDKKTLLEIRAEALQLHYSISLSDLEIIAYQLYSERSENVNLEEAKVQGTPSTLYRELVTEAQTRLVNHPLEDWKTTIQQAAHYLKQCVEISKLSSEGEWKQRIEKWATQNELILCFLDLPESPLLHFARMHLQKNASFQDPSMTVQLRERFLYRYSSPLLEPSIVHRAADITRKYVWYSISSQNSNFQRWIQSQNGTDESKASKLFPLLPFSREFSNTQYY